MKIKLILPISINVMVALGVPFFAAESIAIMVVATFIINPLLAVYSGYKAGKNISTMWFLPFVFAALVHLGRGMVYDASLYVTLCYITISVVTMLLASRKNPEG